MDGVDGVLLYDGRILGTERAGASSLLVEGGRVVASGSRRELLRQRGRGTPLQDLRGRLVLPGLIDSHLHLAE